MAPAFRRAVLPNNKKLLRVVNEKDMPTLFIIFGMRFYFWSRDHEPIHVHVRKGGAEARFVIDPEIDLIVNKGFKPHELALAEEVIKENREIIVEHWKLFFKK
jgi:hypothetical protein